MEEKEIIRQPAMQAGDAVLTLDRSLKLIGCSQSAQNLLGAEYPPTKPFFLHRFMKGLSLAEARAAIDRALTRGRPKTGIKGRMIDRGGRPFTCLYSVHPLLGNSGDVIGVILIIRDAKPAESEKDSAAGQGALIPDGFGAVFDSLPEGIFTIDTNWRITSFNQEAERMTGFAREEVIGRCCQVVFRSELCEKGCPMGQTLETGKAVLDEDVVILDKGGARLRLLVNVSVLRDSRGKVAGAVETFRCLTDEHRLPSLAGAGGPYPEIVGGSPVMRRLFEMLPDVAASEASVLLTGESGTGKEVFARAVHALSPRAKGPFVTVNCAAIPENLLESEFFGHEKGAFTGADRTRVGRFEMAKGGTLFLDEIAELKPELQAKLLRVLEQKVFERVGGSTTIPMDARIVSATNRDVGSLLEKRLFREDLYYRLRTVPMQIPPLRERREDIPLLVNHFIKRYNKRYNKEVRALDLKVMRSLSAYHWPGNVRELERVIEYAYVFVRGPVILKKHLPDFDHFTEVNRPSPTAAPEPDPAASERRAIVDALEQCGGRRGEAAALLGMSRTSLWRRMKSLGLL